MVDFSDWQKGDSYSQIDRGLHHARNQSSQFLGFLRDKRVKVYHQSYQQVQSLTFMEKRAKFDLPSCCTAPQRNETKWQAHKQVIGNLSDYRIRTTNISLSPLSININLYNNVQ